MSSQNQAAARKGPQGANGLTVDEVDAVLKDLLSGGVDVKAESALMQAQLEKLISVYQSRETQIVTTVAEIKEKYASIIKEATDKATNIHATAQKAAAESAKSANHSLAAAKKTATDQVKTATEKGQKILADATAQAAAILATAKKEAEEWEAEKARVADIQKFKPVVKVNVGGTKFTTSLTTLRRFPDTMIGAMYSGRHELVQDDEGYHFIDRDGTHFRYILNFLRSPENFKCELSGGALTELKSECEYYGLEELMFPFKPIPPFTATNSQRISVTVTQDEEAIYMINSIPVRICGRCNIGDYSSLTGNNHGYHVNDYHCYIQNFTQLVEGKNGVVDEEQPSVTSPCRICRK